MAENINCPHCQRQLRLPEELLGQLVKCPACGSAYPLLVQPLITKYGQKIRLEFKHFPLTTIHAHALSEAEAAECAADQGKFWEFLDLAYTKQAEWTSDAPRQWASSLGMDLSIFDRCTASRIKRDEIMAEEEEGKKAGVQGTPTFFINGKVVENDINALTKAIDEALVQTTQRL